MSNIREDQPRNVSVIAGRMCDNCGFKEHSKRNAITFDHGSDYKWAKVQLCLDNYTDPNNNREYYLCSSDCYRIFVLKYVGFYTHKADCLGGVPLRYLKKLLSKADDA